MRSSNPLSGPAEDARADELKHRDSSSIISVDRPSVFVFNLFMSYRVYDVKCVYQYIVLRIEYLIQLNVDQLNVDQDRYQDFVEIVDDIRVDRVL